jgi:hypothetical protein
MSSGRVIASLRSGATFEFEPMQALLPRPPHRTSPARCLFAVPLALALVLAAVGCGGANRDDDTSPRKHRSRSLPTLRADRADDDDRDADRDVGRDEGGIVHWETRLTEDAPGLLDEFRRRASRYGCSTQRDDDSVLAKCAEAPIKLVKRGRQVSVACQGVSLPECRELFGKIVDVEKSPSGQNPRMW